MKREYMKPLMKQDEASACEMLAASINSISSDKGIGFGGMDDDGSQDADIKEFSFWGSTLFDLD